MAKKKPSAAAETIIVAFATQSDEDGVQIGQRLELSEAEFIAAEKAGTVERGTYVKMRIGIEGGRYSLRPGDEVWLAPGIAKEWEKRGLCEVSAADPGAKDLVEHLKGKLQAAKEENVGLVDQLNEALATIGAFEAAIAKLAALSDFADPQFADALAELVALLPDDDSAAPGDKGDEGDLLTRAEG